jgi:NAD(P)-dependent dehydrogenase (short-subunit alcohol dehydrogenase family)
MGISVVTGANRGIGLALVAQLHLRGATVVAVCRQTSPELLALGVRVESGIDVADPHAGPSLATRLAHDDIDLLVHNAGIGRFETLEGTTPSDVMAQFQVNAMAPLFLTRALLPRLRWRQGRVGVQPHGLDRRQRLRRLLRVPHEQGGAERRRGLVGA